MSNFWGSVQFFKDYDYKRDNYGWTNIKDVYFWEDNLIGLKKNGEIVYKGYGIDKDNLLKLQNFPKVKSLKFIKNMIIGIQNDDSLFVKCNYKGIMSFEEDNFIKSCKEISNWKNIKEIIGPFKIYEFAALKKDGTVIVSNNTKYYQWTEAWKDVILITTYDNSIVGLNQDGQILYSSYY